MAAVSWAAVSFDRNILPGSSSTSLIAALHAASRAGAAAIRRALALRSSCGKSILESAENTPQIRAGYSSFGLLSRKPKESEMSQVIERPLTEVQQSV